MPTVYHIQHKLIALLLCGLGLLSVDAWALSCAQDLNGNGAIDTASESATCQSTPQGDLCPISAQACTTTETCPLDPQASCTNGQCTAPQKCTPTGAGSNTYQCPASGSTYADQATCDAACAQTAACTSSQPTCPIDSALTCMDTGGGNYQCSPNTCSDMSAAAASTNPDVTTTTIDTSMPDNSGPRDADGNCLGSLSIFAGRGMNCKKAGLRSGFHDCCDNGGSGLIADSMGSDVGGMIFQQGLSAIGKFAFLTYTNYQAYTALGISQELAASHAVSESLFTMASPVTIYFAAASIVVQYLLTEKCSQEDMETATLVGSKFCHYVGKYCSEKWRIIGCVQKKATYCCFNSMLGRIIQEQGRPQLQSFANSLTGMWGTAEYPLCRGFSPEEFQSLDFSQMNLSEYFGYITQVAQDTINANVPQSTMNNAVQSFYNNIR